jgi:hypothetical protein
MAFELSKLKGFGMSNDRAVQLGVGVVVFLAISFSGWKASTGIQAAKDGQARALDNLLTWKAAYQALLPVKQRWDDSFQVSLGQDQQDMVGVGQQLRLTGGGLRYDINILRSSRVEAVSFEGVPVGLMRNCVAGGPSDSLLVSAPSMREMLDGIGSLVRHDIELSKLEISAVEGQPVASLGGLCVLSRGEEDSNGA